VKIAVSEIKLNQIRTLLEEENAEALLAERPCLIAIIDSMLNLFEGLAVGLGIVDIRKMFGVVVSREENPEGDGSDNDDGESLVTKSNRPTPDGADGNKPEGEEITSVQSCKSGELHTTGSDDDNNDVQKKDPNKNKNHPGKAGVKDYPSARQCHHYHENLKPGDQCPECLRGKLKFSRPRQQILFEGTPPIQPVAHFMHDLICGLCGMIAKATPSQLALDEGLGTEDRYGYSAIAMIVVMKYFSCLPWNRNGRLHGMLGVNLAPSTQFDQTEKLANILKPVGGLEKLISAQSESFMMQWR